MKKCSVGFFLVLISSFLFAPTCEAQFLDKLQKRAEDRAKKRVEQKIESRVDKAVDKTVDAPENAVKENKKNKEADKKATQKEVKNEPSLDLSSLMNGAKDVKLPDTYQFSQKVTYVMTISDTKQTNEMTYWLGTNDKVFGIEAGYDTNTFIVYDMEREAMVMFFQKEKSVQAMPFSMFGAIFDNASDDDTDFTFKKTGETKKISSYNCQKYVMASENLEGEFWFTKDVNLKIPDFSKAFLSVSKSSNQKVPSIDPRESGFLIEMKAKDKSNGSVTQMTVKEITKTNKKLVSSQYKKQ